MSDQKLTINAFVEPNLGSLFHEAGFFRLHAGEGGRYFQWTDGKKSLGTIHFTEVDHGIWRSPARGTFAGYAWERDLSVEQMFAFHDAVEAELVDAGAKRIEILPAPMAHDPVAFANTLYLLRARGFATEVCDLNHTLEVTATPLGERMTYGNRKRLRKAEREGFKAERVGLDQLHAVYDTIAANRAMKGNAVSMRVAQLEEMIALFPDRLVLFGMKDGDSLAASAICLRLSPSVLYVFYWGDRPGYSALSPVVALADTIYAYCQESGIVLLDVGTSTVNLEPNFGLIQFKRGLGFTESLKVRLSKQL
ncbi:Acetyltransferase (GNAT) domain-containing protein [Sphingomonas gellani]|uniref:Acetyltransferase (GNAT) domain-containing protein n=1 Tax=Sphingomonas gellani TaxID=1166340 RepID=A0A1H8I478_9SPHN|nr:GNAT family N-acetyltransferase [Sphingomonas gellani]SEN63111.1 Acetyltransferase (GNAT) domain-containing protein [Sphingomonas gellani]